MHDALLIVSIPRKHGNADADADRRRIAGDIHLHREHAEDRLGQQTRLLRSGLPGRQDHELIAAEAGNHVAWPCAFLENGGNLFENAVAFGMAEYIIDGLEPVEIERKQSELILLAAILDLLVKAGLEHGAVRKTGQNVVAREIFDLTLRLPLFRQVANGHDFTRVAAIFDRTHAQFKHLRLPAPFTDRFHGHIARQIGWLSIHRLEQIVRVATHQ